MAKNVFDSPHLANGPLPDVSDLHTTRLRPRPHQQQTMEASVQQIAQHEAELQRLIHLAATLEQAISALLLSLRLTTDPRLYAALQHTSADLQQFKLEVEMQQAHHQNTLEQLQRRS
jgi:hypothetical protein